MGYSSKTVLSLTHEEVCPINPFLSGGLLKTYHSNCVAAQSLLEHVEPRDVDGVALERLRKQAEFLAARVHKVVDEVRGAVGIRVQLDRVLFEKKKKQKKKYKKQRNDN